MKFVPVLYYSPGSVSLTTHVALEELGIDYRLERVSIPEKQHLSDAYRAIHPLQRLPALRVAEETILTETPALLNYLAALAPEQRWLPREGLARARADEWLSLGASALHVTFISYFRPARYTSDESTHEALKKDGQIRFLSLLKHVESRLPEQGYCLGSDYTFCDTYLAVFFLWGWRVGFPVMELPRYSALAQRVLMRPAFARALQQEGIVLPAAA